MNFDRELRQLFERREPPAGFAERVMAALPQEQSVRGAWRWLAAAAVILVMLAAPYAYRRQFEKAEALAARDQLIAAVRVASLRLHDTKARVLHTVPPSGAEE